MTDIVRKIEEERKKTEDDNQVLQKVMEELPDKKKAFQEALNRGASSTQILEKIIEDNKNKEEKAKEKRKKGGKKAEAKEKKEEKEQEKKEKEKEKKSSSRKSKEKEKRSFAEKIKRKQAALKGSQFFKDFFTATRYLLVGVDISDHSIEVLLLDKDGTVTSYGRSVLEEGVVQNGEILDQKTLSENLRKTLESTKPYPLEVPEHGEEKGVALKRKEHKAIVSLPESKVYVQTFNFNDKSNLYAKVGEEIKNALPFEGEDFYWDFLEVPSRKGVKVVCVATLQDFADAYIHFFKSTNIDPVAFEVEGEAIGRALLPIKRIKKSKKGFLGRRKSETEEVMADKKSRMILDLGARSTMLNIFNENAVMTVSVPLPYAGNYFTDKVAKELNVSKKEAEKIKKKEGFNKDGRTYETLREHGKKIVEEVKEARRYYQREFGSDIKEIFLAGGTALLPGLQEFLNEEVEDVEVKMGDSLRRINDLGLFEERESILYANVAGLGLRSLKKDPISSGINLLPEEVKSQAKKSQQETQRSVLLVALFIAIAGVILLGLAIYYLMYLPVPPVMQPLRDRVLMVTEEPDIEVEEVDVAFIIDDVEEEFPVHEGPGEQTDVVEFAEEGKAYRITAQRAGWLRLEIEEISGWIEGDHVEEITTMELNEFEELQEDEEETEEGPEDDEEEEEEEENLEMED